MIFDHDHATHEHANFQVVHDLTFGKCYSMEIDKNVTKRGVMDITFISRMDIYIYFHHPRQYLDIDSTTKVLLEYNFNLFTKSWQ